MSDPARTYARRYERVQKRRDHGFVEQAVADAGGRVLFTSGPSSAPLFLGVEDPTGARVGLMAYVFHANRVITKNRPSDEHRGQIRYGDVTSREWREAGHPIGFDPTGVDVTAVLVVDPEAGVLFGLDPYAYDPLPLGNSIYFKETLVEAVHQAGWHVWERDTHSGPRKSQTEPGLETVVGFRPSELFRFVALERRAQALGLDQALRYRAAEQAVAETSVGGAHQLERDFGLSSHELLSIINRKSRLAMAMRGGVAEHHLGLALAQDPSVESAEEGTIDGPPDFHVTMADGRNVTVECKNASPRAMADGVFKVEIQKTRASKSDPLSRFYAPDAFEVVAACLYGPTKQWAFRFCRSSRLTEHRAHPGRIAPLQRIDDRWSATLADALSLDPG